MERSQWYIGSPAAVVLCVDEKIGPGIRGRIYHAYDREALRVVSMEQILFELEGFYDAIGFPHPTTNDRTFQGEIQHKSRRAGREKVMSDEELLGRHGELGTFIIRVQHRQNSSWQGRITWMDRDKTVYFRSMWEMLKLVDSALDTVSEHGEDAAGPTWPKEDEEE